MTGFGKLSVFAIVLYFMQCCALAGSVVINFRVTDDALNVLRGTTVRLYCLNRLDTVIENAPATVKLELRPETYYTLEVELQGFVTKRLGIFTDIPGESDKEEYRFFITLEREENYNIYKDAENVLDYPTAIIEFDTNTRVFDYNEQYYLSTRKAFEKLYKSKREIKF